MSEKHKDVQLYLKTLFKCIYFYNADLMAGAVVLMDWQPALAEMTFLHGSVEQVACVECLIPYPSQSHHHARWMLSLVPTSAGASLCSRHKICKQRPSFPRPLKDVSEDCFHFGACQANVKYMHGGPKNVLKKILYINKVSVSRQ